MDPVYSGPPAYMNLSPQLAEVMRSPFVQDTVRRLLGSVPPVKEVGPHPRDPWGTMAYITRDNPDTIQVTPVGRTEQPGSMGEMILHEGMHLAQFDDLLQDQRMSPEMGDFYDAILNELDFRRQTDPEFSNVDYRVTNNLEAQSYALDRAINFLRNRSNIENPEEELKKLDTKFPGTMYAVDWIERMLRQKQ